MRSAKKPHKAYTYRSLRDERRYGPYWYSGLWLLIRPILVGMAVAVAVLGIGMGLWSRVYEAYLAPPEPGSEAAIPFEVESGQSLTRVAANLETAGLVRSKTVFKYYCDFAGMGQKLQAGHYTLNPGMGLYEIADQLTKGDGNPLVRNITMIPGWTVEDFAAKLVADGVLSSSETLLAMCRTGEAFDDYYYIDDVLTGGNAAQRRYVLEGYLAPNTYEIYVTATEEEILRRLLSQTERAFPADYQEQAESMGFTMDQILTLASLIEKEAGSSDFTKVSAVFHNRLKQGIALGSDVTIHYITGVRRMNLGGEDLSVDSPYNTYLHKGLPPGPICNPSVNAIWAALYPDAT